MPVQEVLEVTDFRMAGFLAVRGVSFLRTFIGDKGNTVYVFDNRNQEAEKMMNQYPNSPEQRYDATCRAMHDMVKFSQVKKERL